MSKGKETCKLLMAIRRKIAESNGIEYTPQECTFKGECHGFCPKCESEVQYLEQELHKRQHAGKKIAIAGIAASLAMAVTSATAQTYEQIPAPQPQQECEAKKANAGNVKIEPQSPLLSRVKGDSIHIRGIVQLDNSPAIGANIIDGNNATNGSTTDLDGEFRITIDEKNPVLKCTFVGCETQEISIDPNISYQPYVTIVMKASPMPLMGEVVIVKPYWEHDDIYQ